MKTENKIMLIILAIIGFSLISIISASAQSHLKWFRKHQESVEYPARIKSNQAMTKKTAKANLKDAKKKKREAKKEDRDRQKVIKIREKTKEVNEN